MNQESKVFLETLFPTLNQEYIEVRLLSKGKKPESRFYSTISGLLKDFPVFTKKTGYDCYFGICPRKTKTGNKEAVSSVNALWVDMDAKQFKGGKEEALKRLREYALKPSIIVDSGNGYHAYWKLKENSSDKMLVENCLKGIASELGADMSACEVARIFRLPETLNNKNPKSPLSVKVVETQTLAKYELSDFKKAGQSKSIEQPKETGAKSKDWIAEVLAGLSEGNRNATFAKIVGRLHKDGHDSTAIYSLLSPHAEKCKFSLKELQAEIQGICSRYKNDPDSEATEANESIVKQMLSFIDSLGLNFFLDQYNEPHVLMPESNCYATYLTARVFRNWLREKAYSRFKKVLSGEGLQNVIGILEGKLLSQKKQIELQTRIGAQNGAIYYDLADGRVAEITSRGWKITDKSPIIFRQTKNQRVQIEPNNAGDIKQFLKFVNLPEGKEGEKVGLLVLVWLVASFIPGFPHPVLVVHGAHGSAKSTFFDLLKSLIDPSGADRLSPPHTILDLAISASNHWFLPYDNLSHISDALSDAFCRVCTGDGFSKRQLYTDKDEIIFSFRRKLGINGINLVVDRPDLLDRSLLVELKTIPVSKRLPEAEIKIGFENEKALLLGGIFNVLVKAIGEYATVNPKGLPRMADFTKWGIAITKALGHKEEEFYDAYQDNIQKQHEEAIGANPVARTVVILMKDETYWEGTPSNLLDELNTIAVKNGVDIKSKIWPKDSSWLWKRLILSKNNLLAVGLSIDRATTGENRYITIEKIKE